VRSTKRIVQTCLEPTPETQVQPKYGLLYRRLSSLRPFAASTGVRTAKVADWTVYGTARYSAHGARRARVLAAFLADADRSEAERAAEAAPPFLPPFRAAALLVGLPRPDPLFLPPPLISLTVAQARFSASFSDTPRFL
jgi:hypothetical protein